jgi:hypothetical protein
MLQQLQDIGVQFHARSAARCGLLFVLGHALPQVSVVEEELPLVLVLRSSRPITGFLGTRAILRGQVVLDRGQEPLMGC